MKTIKKSSGPRIRIVGPSVDEKAMLDRMDAPEDRNEWLTIRDHLTALSKRINPKKAAQDKKRGPQRAGSGKRSRIAKSDTDDGVRAAPTTGSDQDAAAYDFVDAIIPPPYPFDAVATLYENSGPLQRNVAAMAANVDGFGYRFEPILDFSHPEIANHVRDLMFLQRVDKEGTDLENLNSDNLEKLEPNLVEVKKTLKLWERTAMVEHHRLRAFFESLHPRYSFTRIRVEMRKAKETYGNAAWEILRQKRDDVYSRIEQVYNVSFPTIQLVRQDRFATPVKVKVRKDAITWDTLTFKRYFRRFVQIVNQVRIYYKEFGDPRVVSRKTGDYYDTIEELRASEGEKAQPANELLHWVIPSPLSSSPYGMARWTGVLLAVLGSRASEEVNYLYFDNKAIPPMVLLVSGGTLSPSTVNRLESFLTERLKGRKNFHKVLVIEGIPAGTKEGPGDVEPSTKLRLEIKPLTSDMLQDGLFQHYDEANELKIGRAFRQPPLLTGDQRDANRSTSDVIKAIVEEQVYQPERDMFDADMDRLFLSNLGIRFWKFRTNAPAQRYPNDLVANATKALTAGAITPNECRGLLADAFSKELPHRTEDWANTPPALSTAAARTGALPSAEPTDGKSGVDDGSDQNPNPDEAPPSDEGPQVVIADEKTKKGAVIAQGRTSSNDGHSHAFVVVRDGDHARVITKEEDGHTHPEEVVRYRAGVTKGEILDPPTDGTEHAHEVRFRFPASGNGERVERFKSAVTAMRQAFESEVSGTSLDFFNAKNWAHE